MLDWNAVNFTDTFSGGGDTTLSQTFTNVDGSGISVTITLELGSSTAQSELVNFADNNTDFNGRGGALDLFVDYNDASGGNASRATDFVKVTISFSQPVINAAFQLWDVDYSNGDSGKYQDVVRKFVTDTAVSPSLSLVSGSPRAQLFTDVDGGAARGIDAASDAGIAGDMNVNYGTNMLQSISFNYVPGDGTNNSEGLPLFTVADVQPTGQHIGLSAITFSAVPEVFSGRGALAACMAAVAAPLLGRRRKVLEA